MIKEIIPTLFSNSKKEFDEKLLKLNFSSNLHIDFMDGLFVSSKSAKITDMDEIKKYSDIFFEIHLMAFNPIIYLKDILNLNIKKVLIQYEAFENKDELIETCIKFQKNNLKVFLVINPNTLIEEIISYLSFFDGIMLMSVFPGAQKQKFINIIDKIILIKKLNPHFIIQIDGGINDTNYMDLFVKGANILSIGSFISEDINPKNKYLDLKKNIYDNFKN